MWANFRRKLNQGQCPLSGQHRAKTHSCRNFFVPNGGALCPVRALEHWLAVSDIEAGPLFRRISRADRVLAARLSGQGIATAIKRAGEAAGLDPDTLGGHSLRAGFVTEAARRGETA